MILDNEVKIYYSEANAGVRRYPKDKVFTTKDDFWPYYLEALGPKDQKKVLISLEEHRE